MRMKATHAMWNAKGDFLFPWKRRPSIAGICKGTQIPIRSEMSLVKRNISSEFV